MRASSLRERKLLGGMHEGKLEWARLKLSPAESADIYGEVQALGVEASGFWYVLVQLQYPPKRRRCHFPLFLSSKAALALIVIQRSKNWE